MRTRPHSLCPTPVRSTRGTGSFVVISMFFMALISTLVAAQDAAPSPEEKAPRPTVRLDGLTVTPEAPGPDTLCKLRVTVRNDGEDTLSALRFDVTVGGKALAVYERQVFMDAVAPGTEAEIELFNFWTTETHRPTPKDGKLTVTVALREARTTTITTEDDGNETWTVGEPISPLSASVTATVALTKPAG